MSKNKLFRTGAFVSMTAVMLAAGIPIVNAQEASPSPVSSPASSSAPASIAIPSLPGMASVGTQSEPAPAFKNVSSADALKKLGVARIDARLRDLEREKDLIQKSKALAPDQISALVAMIDKASSGLAGLKSSIQQSDDANAIRQSISAAYADYRIYGVLLPQIRASIQLYHAQAYLNKLNAGTIPAVQARIDRVTSQSRKAALQKDLDSAKSKLAAVAAPLNDALARATALKPSDYPTASRNTVRQLNADIRSIRNQLVSARTLLVRAR
jgi:predicted  nucleic acid-binding Zn-ribbon protein